jgi:hypothetical protein
MKFLKLFQFTLNWIISMPTLQAHTHTFASLLCLRVPFMSCAIVALLLGHEESCTGAIDL